jgi:hypothetical protein
MKKSLTGRTFIVFIIVILIESSWISFPGSQIISHIPTSPLTSIDGHILFAPMDCGTTYLIDNTGALNHTWTSD